MAKYAGFIAQHKVREGEGRRGPWKADSVLLEPAEGTNNSVWINFGFRENVNNDFPLKQGDYVELEAEKDNGGYLVAQRGTVKRPKNPPARAEKPKQQNSSRGNFNRGGGGGQRFDGTGIQNRTNPEDAKRMSYANARSTAVEVVGLLIANKALPLSAASGKASEAQRYEQVLAAIDKLTVKYHNDGLTLRLLEVVSDEGTVDTKPDAPVPQTKKHAIDDESAEGDDSGGSYDPETPEGDDDDVTY